MKKKLDTMERVTGKLNSERCYSMKKEFLTVYYNEELTQCQMCCGEIHPNQLILKLKEQKTYGGKESSEVCFLCGKTLMNHYEHMFNTKKRRATNTKKYINAKK